MGDISSAQASDVGALDKDTPKVGDPGISTSPPPSHDESRAFHEHDPSFQPQQYPITSQHAFTAQFDMSQPPTGHRPGPYNMGPMGNALPPVNYRPGQYPHGTQQRYNPTSSPPMMQQMPQFSGHPSMPVAAQGYYLQQPQMAQYYGSQMPQAQPGSTMAPRQNITYYPSQMIMSPQQSAYYYAPAPQYQPAAHPVPNGMVAGHYMNGNPGNNDPRTMIQSAETGGGHPQPPKQGQGRARKQSRVRSELKQSPDGAERRQSAVRGPPRKPRQSGHAIWIGNLPPQTDLMSLVHHVCKETAGLESLFLISKSNCAFANFKDEDTCSTAQQKLHDSKFQSVRLVSRLRKSTVEGATGVTAPTGPSVATTTKTDQVSDATPIQVGSPNPADEPTTATTPKAEPAGETTPQKDKFFILKSLTVEDLELSVRTGIWATQAHNEDALNTAFKGADSVYLVFSANKSGEYFGYARMVSQIDEDPAAAIEFAPTSQATSDLDLPKAIPTEATEHAPKGRIIDDSARGTIFWEAEREESEALSDAESESEMSNGKSNSAEEPGTKTWGKPFKLEWLSTSRLPFYRTRGLRNPWNSNREVKIARDGTELEPSVGRRLIGLFNRVQSPGPAHAGIRVPIAMMAGFPPMRPYGQ
ncbi:YTH domain-containing protein [Fusarium sp. LHS14.1]|nr:YTH domain-containing protein [Fusarium sp. LHS14.1]